MAKKEPRSPAVPEDVYTDEEFQVALLTEIQGEWEPDGRDLETLLAEYADPKSRDLIDQVFIALTGWSLATLSARAATAGRMDEDAVHAQLEAQKVAERP